MAFIDDFNKLVVKNGQQQKIANKDKAIIYLANELANGGGGGDSFVTKIESVFIVNDGNIENQQITKIQYDGKEFDGFYIDITNNNENFEIYLSEKEVEEMTPNASIAIRAKTSRFEFSYKISEMYYLPDEENDIYCVYGNNDIVFIVKIHCRGAQ